MKPCTKHNDEHCQSCQPMVTSCPGMIDWWKDDEKETWTVRSGFTGPGGHACQIQRNSKGDERVWDTVTKEVIGG